MPKYRVGIRECHIQWRRVAASTAEEALRLYVEGIDEGEEIEDLEYSHTMERYLITVKEDETS